MNLSAALSALRWLVWDTFRQSMASGTFWLFLATIGLCIVFCLGLQFRDPVASDDAELRLETDGKTLPLARQSYLFGAVQKKSLHGREFHARETLFLLGGLGAQTVGLLLVLAFTAGLLPSFVDPNSALILLAKPIPRWGILLGKFLGVLVLLAVQIVIFVLGTWTAVGLATGVWPVEYLGTIPTLLLHYGIYFSFSAMLAVTTRNAAACVIGSMIFWLLCWGMNIGRDAVIAYDLEEFSAASRFLAELAYWALPKPADLCAATWNNLHPEALSVRITDFARVQEKGAFHPSLSMAASLAFAAVIVGISGYELETADY